MDSVEQLEKLAQVVKWILENEIETRNDDDHLALLVEMHFNPSVVDMDYAEVRKNRFKYFSFTTESIRRCRQRIQEVYPELKATESIKEKRKRKEEEYKEWLQRSAI